MTPSFTALLAEMNTGDDGRQRLDLPEGWLQGRNTYGGLSAAMALHAALQAFPDLPPLRSAQIAFVGPTGPRADMTPTLLRRGKSTAFVNVDIEGDAGIATRAIFVFGSARDSKFDERHLPMPDHPAPEDTPRLPTDHPLVPGFARQFEQHALDQSRPVSGSADHDHLSWVRHRDPDASGLVALVGAADMPPPAVMPKFDRPAPLSSMNWTFNMLTDDPVTEDGWWLMRSVAEDARDGYSSQNMEVWNRAGEPVMAGRQSVAIFL